MDAVFDYYIPQLHPLAVHFPISLVLVACVAALGWAVQGKAYWFRATWLLMTTGFIGALFAYFTGDAMYEQSEGTPMVDLLVDHHEQVALFAVIANGVSWAVCSLIGLSRRAKLDEQPASIRWGLGVIVLITAILITWTSHVGGTMVWGVPR